MSSDQRDDQVPFRAGEFTRDGKSLSGSVSPEALERLKGILAGSDGFVEYSLQGGLRRDGKPLIVLQMRSALSVCCQRCLGSMRVELESERRLVFVSANALPAVEDEEEDTDYLPLEEPIDPMLLVEEELLLSLPMAPRHEEQDCPAGAKGASGPLPLPIH